MGQERWTWWMQSSRFQCTAQDCQTLWKTLMIFQHWLADGSKFHLVVHVQLHVPAWCQSSCVTTFVASCHFAVFSNSFLVCSRGTAWWDSHRRQPAVSRDWWGVWVEPIPMWKCFCKARIGVWEWRSNTENLSSFAHCSGETSGTGYRVN